MTLILARFIGIYLIVAGLMLFAKPDRFKIAYTSLMGNREQKVHLCALSGALYGGPFALDFPNTEDGHIDPSLTELALTIALARYEKSHPEELEDKTIKLWFYGNEDDPLLQRAIDVHDALLKEF